MTTEEGPNRCNVSGSGDGCKDSQAKEGGWCLEAGEAREMGCTLERSTHSSAQGFYPRDTRVGDLQQQKVNIPL